MKTNNDRALSLTELRERNTFLETLLNLSANIIYIYDVVERKKVYSNSRVEKILGYSLDEIQDFGTELIALLLHPDDLKTYRTETLRRYAAAKDHEQVKTEYRIKHRDGTWRWVVSNEKIYLRNDDGTPKQIFGILHDITEHKEAEETLLKTDARYAAMIANTGDVVGIIGADGIMTYKSPNIEKWFGWKPEDLVGLEGWYTVHPDDLDNIQKAFFKLLANDNAQDTVEYRYKCKDGTYTWVELTAVNCLNNSAINGVLLNYHDISSRKQAEDALKESTASAERYLNVAAEIIMSLDVHGTITLLNDSGHTLLGYRCGELIGRNWFNTCLPKEVLGEIRSVFSKFMDSAAADAANYESKVVTKLGEMRSILWHNTLLRDTDGRVTGLLSSGEDITERKKTEEALAESEVHYRTLANSGQALIWTSGLDMKCNYFNQPWLRFTGRTLEQELGDGWVEGVHPDDVAHCVEVYVSFFNRREMFSMDYRVRNACGEYRWIQDDGTPRYNSKGEFLGYIGHCLDISERKQVDLDLATEKERLAVTLRSIGDGVITTDAKGFITMLNKVAEELTGWTSDEAAGRPLPEVFAIVNESTNEQCENPVEKVLATGSIVELSDHTCLVTKDGFRIVIADSSAPIRDKDSKIIGVVLVFRDMSEKQKLNDSMQRAQKLESLGVLAGGIAHDFNNMLGGIFGYLDMANESLAADDRDNTSKYLLKATAVFERARSLTKQLLTFSKGGAPIRKTMPLAPLLKRTAQFALSGSNVALQLDIADDLWLCDCDENQIEQVIDNIVINAKQAMAHGGNIIVTGQNVTIEEGCAEAALKKGNFIKITVQDFGVGMSKEILAKIFDPFFSTKEAGHGLGLATVFSIVQRHDGWIDVVSASGKGSTFHIFIPASQKNIIAVLAKKQETHKGMGTVLIMDDEEFMLEIVGGMLQNMGYAVDEARDGHEALLLFEEAQKLGKPYVVCILDLTIPGGMGGREVVKELRKINREAIVFAASGYSEDPIMAKPSVHGFTDSIVKPFRITELARLLELHQES